MKYKDESGQWKDLVLPATGDTLPVGTVVEFEGDIVPSNWTKVEDETNIITDGKAVKCGYKVDGKDVYARRINLGKGGAGGTTKYFHLNNFGISTEKHNLIDYICVARYTDGGEMVLPNILGNEYSIYCWFNGYINEFHLKTEADSDTSNHDILLTIYYTNK